VSAKAVIIDCDPGVDDAIALIWALSAPEKLEVLAITTVAGNVGAELTARNARIIRQIVGCEAVPVHAGAVAPLVRTPIGAGHFHGESGLGWLPVFEPLAQAAQGHSADAIIDAVMARPPGAVSIAVMGPMTNLALAMRLQPAIIDRLAEVVIMGGARTEGGNITASAEYNVHADPHAAQIVLTSGARCVVLGLDVTHQVRATPERRSRIAGLRTPAARTAANLLDFAVDVQRRQVGPDAQPPMHDPCTIAWLLAPELFETVAADIRVETASPLSQGHTAVEFRLSNPAASRIRWAVKADPDCIFDLLLEALSR
jgi:purine nucleosidase